MPGRLLLILISLLTVPVVALERAPSAPDALPGATILSAEGVVNLILASPDLVVIDSRKRAVYLKGHIEGAVNIDNTGLTRARLEAVAPSHETMLVFYCHGTQCLRSADVIRRAIDWGYSNIFWFRGGWEEWIDKRLPVVSDCPSRQGAST